MARFGYRISAAIRRWCKRRERRQTAFSMMALRGDDDAPRGPGWFDSSWDLDRGLEIRWVRPGDPGFAQWIEAMAHVPQASEAVAPDEAWRAQAIEFVIDEAPPIGPDAPGAAVRLAVVTVPGHGPVSSKLAPVLPSEAVEALETFDFEVPELELVPV